MVTNIEEVKEFFFEAALATWAGEGKKTTIADLPQSKVLIYERGKFRYVDLYYVSSASQESLGQTTIWYDDTPVWGMQFGGYYPEDVISFLKVALRSAYQEKAFHGGRGLPIVTNLHDGLFYTNHADVNDFSNFSGEERIYLERELVGRHWYRGYSLL